jgi:hypothetical protein
MGNLVNLLNALDKRSSLDEIEEDYKGDADEDHSNREAPVCYGDVKLCDTEDGLNYSLLVCLVLETDEGLQLFHPGYEIQGILLTVTNVRGKKSMLITVRMRILSP